MSDPLRALDALLQGSSAAPQLYPPTSRYYGLPAATLNTPDGRSVAYLTRRFVPRSDRFTLLSEHLVAQGDRLDVLSAKYLGDPGQYWRICDANDAMRPADLTEDLGRPLRLTLSDDLPLTAGGD